MGFSSTIPFYARLLDWFGIKVHAEARNEYKSAVSSLSGAQLAAAKFCLFQGGTLRPGTTDGELPRAIKRGRWLKRACRKRKLRTRKSSWSVLHLVFSLWHSARS